MPPIIPILLATALGFGIGYKFRDCICKKDKYQIQPDTNEYSDDTQNVASTPQVNSGFSLQRIENIFRQYNVPLASDYSFSRLLDVIEKESYVSLLKHIDKEISAPNELFHFLEDEQFNVKNFVINNSDGKPFVTVEYVNKLLENKGINYSHLKTIEEKVEFLLVLAQGTGTKRFQESFGNDLATFLHLFETGEDISIVFEEIKSTVHKRLDFLSY